MRVLRRMGGWAAAAALLVAAVVGSAQRRVPDVHRAQGVELYRGGGVIEAHRAAGVAVFTADVIEPDSAKTIEACEARGVRVIVARPVTPFGAKHLDAYLGHLCDSFAAGRMAPYAAPAIAPVKSRPARLFTRAELEAMTRTTMKGYGRSGAGGSPTGTLTDAQIRAYGALNHNIGVWSSGNPFSF